MRQSGLILIEISAKERKMKRTSLKFLAILVFVCVMSAFTINAPHSDEVYQVSTISALQQGVLGGTETFRVLGEHGDFALGTFEGLDGEMVGIDGRFYQIKFDGSVHAVDPDMKTPFAETKYFMPDRKAPLDNAADYGQLIKKIDGMLSSRNVIHAVKIEGKFKYLKVRSVPGQTPPYPGLDEVVKKQSVFEFNDIEGTIVGFYFPASLQGANVAGYHFHFISADRKKGGHVLDCVPGSVTISVDEAGEYRLSLPKSKEFYSADLSGRSGSANKSE
jgi:acetolactate decarboxylase